MFDKAFIPSSRAGLAAIAVSALLACQTSGRARGDEIEGTLSVGGLERHYRMHVSAASGSKLRPLVMVLHGGGGSGERLARRQGGGFEAAAEGAAPFLVYPDGVDKHWNDGRVGTGHRAHEEAIDDVAFLRALVDHLAGRHPIDRGRIYVTGISNGGMMSLRLACEASDLFAAAAALTAALPEPFAPSCRPARPIPVMLMNGTEDELVPYGGGEIRFGRRRLGRVWSTPRTVDHWVRRNGCPTTPRRRLLPDVDPDDGTRVFEQTYGPCRMGSEVVLFTVRGGGHTWPGAGRNLAKWLVGRSSRDIDATREIWRFFRRHKR